jgi:hypothetical protein
MMEVEQLTQQAAARTGMARVTVLRKRQVVEALVPMVSAHDASLGDKAGVPTHSTATRDPTQGLLGLVCAALAVA